MSGTIVRFQDWTFEVDRAFTEQTYEKVLGSGADTCICSDCKNYVAYRDRVFPDIILNFFKELGIDYRKEVEVSHYETLPDGLRHIGGWFHFKGRVLTGKTCRVPLPGGGHSFSLTKVQENFKIGFAPGKDLTFFNDQDDLVQIEFETNIPWVLRKTLS